MQRGCLKRINRKRGPDVWQFRWPETNPKGRRLYPKKIIGTLEQFPEENAARRRVAGLITEINATERSPSSSTMTIGQLCDPFEQSISFIRARGAAQPVPFCCPLEIKALINVLELRERTLVLLAASTVLPQIELFGLEWGSIDFAQGIMNVTRSVVYGVVGPCKTESSQKPVPVHPSLAKALTEWKAHCPYHEPND